ncbi:hypothetical protein E4U26_004420 [Claviceps purpurea]|nr:hypothetical protein E4U26_004420 [Claviceps purpurea]
MSGKIGSTARSLFRLAWTVKTEAEVSRFITRVEESMSVGASTRVWLKTLSRCDPHENKYRDGTVDEVHVTGRLYSKSSVRLISFHAYHDGTVRFGKIKQIPKGLKGSEKRLAWKMNADNTRAMWCNGKAWRYGEWSGS